MQSVTGKKNIVGGAYRILRRIGMGGMSYGDEGVTAAEGEPATWEGSAW